MNEDEKTLNTEKLPSGEEETTDATKETPSNETEEKEPENKVMIFSIIWMIPLKCCSANARPLKKMEEKKGKP